MNGKLEQTKRQIGQLQSDLAAARMQLKQRGSSAAMHGHSSARRTLEREFDDTSESRHSVLIDGFAETQPAPQEFTQHGSLLLQ
jgi:predicted  nucleic acid-binding Zn-ribbon protein